MKFSASQLSIVIQLTLWSIMPGRALSEGVKRMKKCQASNLQMDLGLTAYKAEMEKANRQERRGSQEIAGQFGVNYRTLLQLFKGGHSLSSFNKSKHILSNEEEELIIEYALESASQGFPNTLQSLHQIEQKATVIIQSHLGSSAESLGPTWANHFVLRHHEHLQGHNAHHLDKVRAQGLNPPVVSHWFNEIVKKNYIDVGIKPENTYAMDESGFTQESICTQ